MFITWHGNNCVKIISQKNKDGAVSILADLFDKDSGIRPPKSDADVLIFTSRKNIGKIETENSFLIKGPGEYDIKGVYIQGIPAVGEKENADDAIFKIDAEEIKICHIGAFSKAELSTDQLEELGDIDILIIPVGGGNSLSAKDAIKIMAQVEPKITIPVNYKTTGAKAELAGLDEFLKALGIKSLPAIPKLSIKKKEIPEEEAKVVVLES